MLRVGSARPVVRSLANRGHALAQRVVALSPRLRVTASRARAALSGHAAVRAGAAVGSTRRSVRAAAARSVATRMGAAHANRARRVAWICGAANARACVAASLCCRSAARGGLPAQVRAFAVAVVGPRPGFAERAERSLKFGTTTHGQASEQQQVLRRKPEDHEARSVAAGTGGACCDPIAPMLDFSTYAGV